VTDEGSLELGSKKFQELTGRNRSEELAREMALAACDPKTGLLKESIAEYRRCPLCGASPEDTNIMFVKYGFHYRRCLECEVSYVSPMLKEDDLLKSYEQSEFNDNWMRTLMGSIEQGFNRPKFELGINQIEETVGDKGKILELGSAVGQFLDISKDAGWKVHGIEFNNLGANYCRQRGHEISQEPLADNSFANGSFDAVAMWEVLEHVIDPRQIISTSAKVLRPGGAIFVVVPNVDSLAAQIMQERCNMFRGTAHLTMFKSSTINRLLEEEGFQITHSSTIISEISVINNYLHYVDPYLGEAPEMHPIFDVLDETYIHKNLLGYKLKVIGRKKH
jgi:2-polyprenyl-3-methyl-5-hydroxy-6-metoxy-1,4-benzoquinol methylase